MWRRPVRVLDLPACHPNPNPAAAAVGVLLSQTCFHRLHGTCIYIYISAHIGSDLEDSAHAPRTASSYIAILTVLLYSQAENLHSPRSMYVCQELSNRAIGTSGNSSGGGRPLLHNTYIPFAATQVSIGWLASVRPPAPKSF